MKRCLRAALTGLLLLAAGCASVPQNPAARAEFKTNNDPIEPFNRKIFAFNLALDRAVIKPVAEGYRAILPRPIRNGLRNVLDNLDEPLVVANCLLQGRFNSAFTAGGRFAVNSTVGVAGIIDIATRWKMPKQTGDFGQTLWSWNVPEGPYLVIPLFGPSNPRDAIGQGVDVYLDPFRYVPGNHNYPQAVTTGRIVADGVDQRARNIDSLNELQRQSIDFYASMRSLYRQNRAAELRNGKPAASTLPPADFYDAEPGR